MKVNFAGGWRFRKNVTKTLEQAVKMLGQPSELEMSVSFVKPEVIKALNAEMRQVDSVTDVLSFPALEAGRTVIDVSEHALDVNPESGKLFIGDVVICTKRAKEQAKEYGHSLKREVCFLATHGLLHLLGYDHVEPEDEKQMVELQKQILNGVGITRK